MRRYDAHVLRDMDRKAPARPRQHLSCAAAAAAATAAAAAATAAASWFDVSYSLCCPRQVAFLLLEG